MDIEKYISSGILEAYALGDLSSAEKAEVEEVLSQYPEARAELALIEESLEGLALHAAIAPKEDLKAKVLGKALEQENVATPAGQEHEGKTFSLSKQRKEKVASRSTYQYYLAAAITVAVLSGFAAVYFFNKWQAAENRLLSVVAEQTALAQQFHTVENRLKNTENELAVYTNKSFNEIELEGLAIAPEAEATVLWNKTTREVFLNPSGLPASPTDKQYQLWAIVDGQPVSLGLVSAEGSAALLEMSEIANAAAFAITLEPAGGSPSPTLDQMYVLGKTTS